MRHALLLAILATAAPSGQARAPEIDSITQADMEADLYFLASDRMAGRLTATPENGIAAEWIAARFRRLGLSTPGSSGTYFHDYNLVTATLGARNALTVEGAGDHAPLGPGVDFYPHRFSATATARGAVVFVGFGMSSPERGYDDYRGDVRGKIVIALDHEPGESDPASIFDGVVASHASGALMKTLAAQEHGAAAILFVDDVHNHPSAGDFDRGAAGYWPARQPRIPSFMLGDWVERVRIPALQVSPALVDELVRGTGRTLRQLAAASEGTAGAAPVPLPGIQIEVAADVDRQTVPDRNVVGLIEGVDPRLKHEVVIVCAHYDHDGTTAEDVLNGADDNGSGTVAVLEIAEAYARAAAAGRRPRRSVLFAAWNSEERGLFGAWAYTERPLVPLDRTAAVVNMDMIGRNEEIPADGGSRFRGLEPQTAESNENAVNLIGTTRSESLRDVMTRANAGVLTLRLRYDNNISQLMRRSDQWPFLNRGVPAVWVHTGLHPDYHRTTDDPDRINYRKMERIARMVHQASWDLANADVRPSLDGAAGARR